MYNTHDSNYSHAQEELKIVMFQGIETGTYNRVYHRPFDLNITGNAERLITDELRRSPGVGKNIVEPASFRGRLFDFLAPSANVGSEVHIPDGWNTVRYRWFMETEWYSPLAGRVIRQFITGRTDPTEVSHSGLIDPNLRFYISSCFDLRETSFGNDGRRGGHRLNSSDHVIADPDYRGIRDGRGRRMVRPTDVIQTSTLPTEYLREMARDGAFNSTGIITDSAEISSRSDSNPALYLSNILNQHSRAMSSIGMELDSREEAINTTIINTMSSVTKNRFLNFIRNAVRSDDPSAVFTYGELMDAFPGIDDIFDVYKRDSTSSTFGRLKNSQHFDRPDWMLERHTTNTGTETLNGGGYIDQVAAILATTVPEIAVNCFLSNVIFTVTNKVNPAQNGGLPYKFHYTWFEGPTSSDPERFLDQFETRLALEVLDNMSHNNDIDFEIQIALDVFNDIRMEIFLDDGRMRNPIPYCYPTFCEDLYAPIITDNDETLNNLAESVNRLLDLNQDVHLDKVIKTNTDSTSFEDEDDDDRFGQRGPSFDSTNRRSSEDDYDSFGRGRSRDLDSTDRTYNF